MRFRSYGAYFKTLYIFFQRFRSSGAEKEYQIEFFVGEALTLFAWEMFTAFTWEALTSFVWEILAVVVVENVSIATAQLHNYTTV